MPSSNVGRISRFVLCMYVCTYVHINCGTETFHQNSQNSDLFEPNKENNTINFFLIKHNLVEISRRSYFIWVIFSTKM